MNNLPNSSWKYFSSYEVHDSDKTKGMEHEHHQGEGEGEEAKPSWTIRIHFPEFIIDLLKVVFIQETHLILQLKVYF